MKKLILLALLLLIVAQCHAQKKTVALKFDEFDDTPTVWFSPYADKEITVSQRIKRYVNEIKHWPDSQAYIIYYRARQVTSFDEDKSSSWANSTEWALRDLKRFHDGNIVTLNGGYRERNTIEYWIVPKNAPPPFPTPTFQKSQTFLCPRINVFVDGLYFDKTKPIYFRASVDSKQPVSYKWEVSAGEIVEGQGKDFIKIDMSKSDSDTVTAYAQLDGLPLPCNRVAYATLEIGKKPYLIDSAVRYNESYLSALVDSCMVVLNNNLQLKGYIIVYASRVRGPKQMDAAIASVKRIFAFRKYDYERVTLIKGGFREDNSVDMWLYPIGTNPPEPTPSTNDTFVTFANKRNKRRR